MPAVLLIDGPKPRMRPVRSHRARFKCHGSSVTAYGRTADEALHWWLMRKVYGYGGAMADAKHYHRIKRTLGSGAAVVMYTE